MATLFLMVGLPGSGKTTLAKQLERDQPAFRLTPDEWMLDLGIDGFDEEKRALIEALQWKLAARSLELGIDVVLDFGLWSRQERDDFRARATALGANSRIVYLEISRADQWARISARNSALTPGAFHIGEEHLDEWFDLFEPPTSDELEP